MSKEPRLIDTIELAKPVANVAALFQSGAANLVYTAPQDEVLNCPQPINLEGNDDAHYFTDSPVPILYEPMHRTGSITLAALSDVALFTAHAYLVDRNDRVIAETYHNRDIVRVLLGETDQRTVERLSKGGTQRRVEDPVFCPFGPWSWIYHHWLIETLPRLRWLDVCPELANFAVLVPKDLSRFQAETLAALEIDDSRFLPFHGGFWQFRRLFFPSYPAPGGYSRRQVSWLRDRLSPALGVKPQRGGRRIHIARRDATSRRLTNQVQVDALLAAHGFETVSLSDMTVADQAKLFAEADIVVGNGGSGLSNMVFAPDGAALLEFQPSNYVNRAHWYLCSAALQAYAFVIGSAGDEKNDFGVEPEKIETALEELYERPVSDTVN